MGFPFGHLLWLWRLNQNQPNKASGIDFLPPELFKSHSGWWALLLAGLFIYINDTGCIPARWAVAIIVPLHKKRGKDNPNNYRPISLIRIVAKIYAKDLLSKIEDWILERNLLVGEQAGFRPERSTIDKCFILYHLITKQLSNYLMARNCVLLLLTLVRPLTP